MVILFIVMSDRQDVVSAQSVLKNIPFLVDPVILCRVVLLLPALDTALKRDTSAVLAFKKTQSAGSFRSEKN